MKWPVASLTIALLFAWVSAPSAQQAPPLKSSIEGVVVQSRNGEPIEGAQVTVGRATILTGPPGVPLLPPTPPPPPPPPPLPPIPGGTAPTPQTGAVTTGSFMTFSSAPTATPVGLPGTTSVATTSSEGKFVLRDLEPGTYRITIAADGFARQEYGQRVFPGAGTPVTLDAGESLKGLNISLVETGSVSGRLRNTAGRPAVGVPVQLLKPVYNASGQRSFQASGTARTNDRGEYRLYWITPGRYFINAGTGAGPINRPVPLGGGPASPNEITTNSYTMTFYPGVTDLNIANAIEVQPGGELSGIDFVVAPQQLRRIRGRVIDSRTGQPPPAVTITLMYSSLGGGGGSFGGTQNYNAATGSFEVRDVVPGAYTIEAGVRDTAVATPLDPVARTGVAANAIRATAALNLSDADIENLVFTVTAPSSISGRLSIEGQAFNSVQGVDRIRVQVRPSTDSVPVPQSVLFGGPAAQPVAADGTFRLDGMMPNEYALTVTGLPPGSYVKEARFDLTDVLNKPMQFLGGSASTLEIVLSPRAAQVDGRVLDSKFQPVAGVQTVLIPDNARKRFDLYKVATTDKNGAFSFANIPPGDYKVFSWEALESFAYFDPDVLQQYEPKAKPLHILEGSKTTIDVTAIPASR